MAELALNLRYTLNAKKVKVSKLKKDKERAEVKRVFKLNHKQSSNNDDFTTRIERLNAHFQNR